MAQYRKKPVVVEAFQFKLDAEGNPVQWGPVLRAPGENQPFYVVATRGIVPIRDERVVVVDGDWIVTEPDGSHHYVYKPDVFEAEYERIW